MITKTYEVNNISEVQALIDAELGPNAVILTSRHINPKGIRSWFASKKIEVTVAVDEEDLKIFNPKKASELLGSREQIQTTTKESKLVDWQDHLATLKRFVADLTEQKAEPAAAPAPNYDILSQLQETLRSFAQPLNTSETQEEKPSHEKPEAKTGETQNVPGIVHFLTAKGISRAIAMEVVESIHRRLGVSEMPIENQLRTALLNTLKRELAGFVRTAGPITLTQGNAKICAFVGPTGVGKTTTIKKIALQYAQELDKRVVLVNLTSQISELPTDLEMFSQKYNLAYHQVCNFSDLQAILTSYNDTDLLLIDTPGRNPYQWQKVDELADILGTINNLETKLVLSSTTKDIDLLGAIQQFSRLNVESIIFTKLDETIAFGVFVNVSHKSEKPISYLTNGQDVPGGLVVASSDELARSILVQHNTAEFDSIRQLANK